MRAMSRMSLLILGAAVLLSAGCRGGAVVRGYNVATGGDPNQGKTLMFAFGCGSCHVIPGVEAATGLVGPPLNVYARRTFVAGEVPNTAENLEQWIKDPQSIEPKTAMPSLGVTDQQARDMAAYLYTLK